MSCHVALVLSSCSFDVSSPSCVLGSLPIEPHLSVVPCSPVWSEHSVLRLQLDLLHTDASRRTSVESGRESARRGGVPDLPVRPSSTARLPGVSTERHTLWPWPCMRIVACSRAVQLSGGRDLLWSACTRCSPFGCPAIHDHLPSSLDSPPHAHRYSTRPVFPTMTAPSFPVPTSPLYKIACDFIRAANNKVRLVPRSPSWPSCLLGQSISLGP